MPRHSALLACCLIWCSCFRGLDAVEGEAKTRSALQLEVTDQNDGIWDRDNAPRWPVLTLRTQQHRLSDAARHVHLLRGTPSEDTLTDLASGTLRAGTQQRRIELRAHGVQTDAHAIRMEPMSPLEAAARYTLVWAEPAGAQTFSVRISDSPAAGAQLVQSIPAELDARVPPNLARALLRFDGYLQSPTELPIELLDAGGAAVPSRATLIACPSRHLPEGDCIEVVPQAALGPGRHYKLVLRAGLRDAGGAPLAAREISFRTAPQDDRLPPEWLKSECAVDEQPIASGCVLRVDQTVALRLRSSEGGSASLACGERITTSLASGGDLTLTIGLMGPTQCLLTLSDLAENSSATSLSLAPSPDLARVSIAEIRADPLGPEPSQEYVELLNFGDDTVSIEGFTLTTDPFSRGLRIASALSLAAGERVLVVAPDFDSEEPSDGPLPPGVRLVRLERSLSLRNDGAALYLRDAMNRRLSASPALAGEEPGQCVVRIADDLRSGAASAFAPDVNAGCTPGYADAP